MGNFCFSIKNIQSLCKECSALKLNSLSHCTYCKTCTLRSMYHCKECKKCVHFTQSHCYKCQMCTNKNNYHCNICNKCVNENFVHCTECHATFTTREYNHHSKTVCKESFILIPIATQLLENSGLLTRSGNLNVNTNKKIV